MDLEPMTIRWHTVVAVPATRPNTMAIAALAADLGKPPSSCAFCPGYQPRRTGGSLLYQSHNCRWFKTFGHTTITTITQCEGAVRYVSTEIWPIVQLRLP